MKKLLIGLLSLGLLLPFTPVQGKEAPKSVKEAVKPKKANVIKVSVAQFKADPAIVKSMKEFKAKRAKQAKVMSTFSFLQDTVGAPGSEPQKAQAMLSPEDLQTSIVSGKLGAIMTYLENQTDKGSGDMDYWIRTRSLLAMEGNIACAQLNRILQVHGTSISGLLQASLKNIATNLGKGMGKYNSGYGDLDYWVAASGNTRDSLWQAAANIKVIREAIASPNSADAMPLVKGQLEVVQAFLAGQGDQGSGNIDYWIRTRAILAAQAQTGTQILRLIIDHYGPQIIGLLRTSISNIANNLAEVGQKYNGGYGDLDYWVAASSNTRDGIRAAGRNLMEILNSI